MHYRLRTLLIVLALGPPVLVIADEDNRRDVPPFQNKIVIFGAQRVPRSSGVVEIIKMNPDGTEIETLIKLQKTALVAGRISPDGRRLAFGVLGAEANIWETWIWEAGKHRKIDVNGEVKAWSPDGLSLLCVRPKEGRGWESFRVEIASGKTQALRVPPTDVVDDISPSGDVLLMMAANAEHIFEHHGKGAYPLRQLDLLPLNGSGRKRITPEPLHDNIWSRFSPDGSIVAHEQRRHEGNLESDRVFEYYVVHHLSDGRTVEIVRPDKLDEQLREVSSFPSYPYYWVPSGAPCWSPDGSQIAVCLNNGKWRSFHQRSIDQWRWAIVFATPQGKLTNQIDLQKLGVAFAQHMDWK